MYNQVIVVFNSPDELGFMSHNYNLMFEDGDNFIFQRGTGSIGTGSRSFHKSEINTIYVFQSGAKMSTTRPNVEPVICP